VRFALRVASLLSAFLILSLAGIVLLPRVLYGTPTGDWLTWQPDAACQLPCWRGITPGKTVFNDAEARLRQFPDVEMVYFQVPNAGKVWAGRFILHTQRGTIQGLVSVGGMNYLDVQQIAQIQFDNVPRLAFDAFAREMGTPDLYFIPKAGSAQSLNLIWARGIIGQTIPQRNIGNRLCDSGLDGLRLTTIVLTARINIAVYAESWTNFDGLRQAQCVAQ
jgi:hypothetical protein